MWPVWLLYQVIDANLTKFIFTSLVILLICTVESDLLDTSNLGNFVAAFFCIQLPFFKSMSFVEFKNKTIWKKALLIWNVHINQNMLICMFIKSVNYKKIHFKFFFFWSRWQYAGKFAKLQTGGHACRILICYFILMARYILAILIKSSQVRAKVSRCMTIVRAFHIYFGFKSWSDLHNAYY